MAGSKLQSVWVLLFLFQTFCFFSCSYNGEIEDSYKTVKLTVYIPEWPPQGEYYENTTFPDLVKWQVSVLGQNLNKSFEIVKNFQKEDAVESFELKVSKNQPVSITIQPITRSFGGADLNFFKPAGAIYPYDLEPQNAVHPLFNNNRNKCLKLSWEQGFGALVMQQLYFSSAQEVFLNEDGTIWEYISYFNWKKLQQLVLEKIDQSKETFFPQDSESPIQDFSKLAFYNPWQIDFQTILEAIAYRKITAGTLSVKSVFSAIIPPETTTAGSTSALGAKNAFGSTNALFANNASPESTNASIDTNALFANNASTVTNASPSPHILSSFIPENPVIQKYNCFTLQKNKKSVFLVENTNLLLLKGSSAKNLSKDYLFLPIQEKRAWLQCE
ncbi:MAG: hypothetical protein MJ188_01700 [Treponema sp.]|nr:hypothetical protein [Treponema sp.]